MLNNKTNNIRQLILDIQLHDQMNFANFFIGNNIQLINILKNLSIVGGPFSIFIYAQTGLGKSHLLNAVCQLFSDKYIPVAYLPLEDVKQFELNILDNIENLDLLCIDDIHLIAGNHAWEKAIFHCFNNILHNNKKIVITSNIPPQYIPFKILDLKSRMLGGLIYPIFELNDDEKISSLKLKAKIRGINLNTRVAKFLLNHYDRSQNKLFDFLEKIDRETLEAKRKITVPFLKVILQKNFNN